MRAALAAGVVALVLAPAVRAQVPGGQITVVDSIAVEGARRVAPPSVIAVAGLGVGEPLSYRDVQRAIENLYATGQFADVQVAQGTVDGRQILRITVVEHPLVTGWSVRGAERLPERRVRGQVSLLAGRPYDPAAAAHSRAGIDSLYLRQGYHGTQVAVRELSQPDGTLRVVFDVTEGRRVTISQVIVEGNAAFDDGEIVGHMDSKPEGFWWWRKGEFAEDKLERDTRQRIADFYASQGYIDFQVTGDSLIVDPATGKATLVLTVYEGDRYEVGTFDVVGNRQFSTEQLQQFYPFGARSGGFLGLGGERERVVFNRREWDDATQQVQTLYADNGYIYARVAPAVARRTTSDGRHVVDLRWQIAEGRPAIVNKILIRGNTVTHEDVIRRAILLVPGDVLRQNVLIRSYQNISNLGFFEQPLPPPTTEPANQQGDVNVVFHVTEKHTGNVNFGASVGQGTGVGGFIGLQEPNLFGRAKQISLQWQFGRNINDFQVSYTDPALWGSLTSSTLSLHNSILRFTVADLGRIRSRGGSIQVGFPVRGSRFTRLFVSYSIEQSQFQSQTLAPRFRCENCVLSTVGLTLTRDTRVGLPFATGGAMHRFSVQQSGGPIGGTGDFRRATFEGRWYTPLAQFGGSNPLGGAMTVVMGLSGQTGFIWGDPGPHFRQLFSMGGTQFGIPLRGYDEFSITPQGFDPRARGQRASTVDAFGEAYLALTGEIGLRISQAVYFNTFLDAGNVWTSPAEFNPTRLFRGAGVGVSLVTPIGPIGLDYAFGFDRVDLDGNPDPGWKFHFKLGQFF